MARRKQLTATSSETSPAEYAALQAGTAAAVLEAPELEPPEAEPLARQWRANPWTTKTVNLGGYRIALQESRPQRQDREAGDDSVIPQRWTMQIRFGDGSKDDMPSDAVLDYLKSQKKTVTTRDGNEAEVQLFRWNRRSHAWAMDIDFEAPRASRLKAEQVFDEVADSVATERGIERQR